MSRRNLLILLLATAVSFACYVRGESRFARFAAEGMAEIQQGSLEPVPDRELFEGAMRGMVDVLHEHGDAHSQFLNEAEANPLRSEIHQQFGGIGVRIGFVGEQHRLAIAAPPDPGSPAATAKLQRGDYILAIDDQATVGMNLKEVLRLVRGEPGTTVRLSIQPPADSRTRTVELVRAVVNIESVLGDRRDQHDAWIFKLQDDPRISQVRITSFGDHTATEFRAVMEKLTADGVKAAVLDLRDNPGGSLDAAVSVCESLLPAGTTIVETRGRGQVLLRRYATTRDGLYVDLPVAVVVNQNSASAAEIIAACLQDQGRAVIVGQRTYGKGTVQQLLPLETGKSLLKLTWASFWRPSGANIQRAAGAPDDANWGVLPNTGFERKLSPDEYKAYKKYRDDRDGFSQFDSAVNVKGDASLTAANFVDEPLRLAVAHLHHELSDQQ